MMALHSGRSLLRWLRKKDEGMIALEATISLVFFSFVMLALYSLVTFYMAQSIIGHALVESCQSLSLETYATDQLSSSWTLGGQLTYLLNAVEADGQFVSNQKWFKETYGTDAQVVNVCRTRFMCYLGGGDESNADKMLRGLGIRGGSGGMDFSASKLADSDLTMAVSYEIQLLFGVERLNLFRFQTTQSACSRIWGKPDL